MSQKSYLKGLKRKNKKILQKNKKLEITSHLVWKQKNETFSLQDWLQKKIENSGFSSGEDLEKSAVNICKRISIPDLIFSSPMYDDNGILKEICDIIVVHKDTILAFQVKHKTLSPSKNADVIKGRAEKTCGEAIAQFNAITKIFDTKKEIICKNLRGNEIKIVLEQFKNREFICLVCFPGKENFPEEKNFEITNSFSYFREIPVHLFDIDDFDKITMEFDTTADFLQFTKKRKLYFKNNVAQSRELDLVASMKIYYEELWKDYELNNGRFFIPKGLWNDYLKMSDRTIYKRAQLNAKSYLFDFIMENSYRGIGYNLENDSFDVDKSLDINTHLICFLEFSRINRIYRRSCSEAITTVISRASKNSRLGMRPLAYRLVYIIGTDLAFIILAVDNIKISRQERINLLINICKTAVYKFPVKTILGIATESSDSKGYSEDKIVVFEEALRECSLDQEFLKSVDFFWNNNPIQVHLSEFSPEINEGIMII